MHIPEVTAAIGFGVPMAIALVLARFVSRWAVRSRRPAWIEQLAAENALDRETLAQSFGSWN
jgi:hypothetical protein